MKIIKVCKFNDEYAYIFNKMPKMKYRKERNEIQ